MHGKSQGQEPISPLPTSNTEHQSTEQSTLGESVCKSHYVSWESAPNPRNHFSIGDQGATASINAYGQMMLFRNFLGVKPSGFISLEQLYKEICSFDPSTVVDPSIAERAKQLEWMSRNPLPIGESAFGLKFPGLETGKELPRLSLLRYRWPRYQYRTDKWELDIHWMIHDDHLLQQCIVKNLEPSPLDIEFKFCNPGASVVVRNLDLNAIQLGSQDSSQACPDGYGWYISKRLFGSPGAVQKRRPPFWSSSLYTSATGDLGAHRTTESAAVVISVFLNGEPMRWKAATSAWTHRLEARTSKYMRPSNTMEVVVAYHLCHSKTSDADLGVTSIPAAASKVAEFLRREPFSPIRISGIDLAGREDFQNFPSPDSTTNGVGMNENVPKPSERQHRPKNILNF